MLEAHHVYKGAQPRCKSWEVRLGHLWCESRGRGVYCGSGGSRIFERGVVADHVKSWGSVQILGVLTPQWFRPCTCTSTSLFMTQDHGQ